MKKYLLSSACAFSIFGLAAAGHALAQGMAHSYEVTVTNTMETELIAPVLVAGTESDSHIFSGNYVTPEAEVQVLTGDPKKLAARIGAGAAVAHGEDGPPGVLLAPGKSLTFTIETAAPEIRIFAMVAPTEKPDNYLTATVNLGAPMMDDKMAAKPMEDKAMAAEATGDTMMEDTMMIPAGGQLMLGDSGERVVMLRKRLGIDAMGSGAMVFDADVKSAVMDYQSKAGLRADGIVGPRTLKSLNSPMDDAMMAKDTMAKDSMAKDTMMESKDAMAKDSMAKDSMAKGDAMMKDEAMTAMLHRFDIGHDEKTMTTTAVDGSFGTVTVKPL